MEQGRKRQRMIESSVQLEDLQDDLLIEILYGVPYKDLMRCKCISKRWLSLISNPDFVERHRIASIKKLRLRSWTFMYRSTKTKKLTLTSKEPVFQSQGFSLRFLHCYPVHILHTFNDLVLCRNKQNVYYVCNPSTMQWVCLPPNPRYPINHGKISVSLICEPSKEEEEEEEETVCMFKVVQVNKYRYYYTPYPALKVDIFSSENEQWVTRNVELPNKRFRVWKAVACNGTLFAIACDGQIMALNLNSLINHGNSTFTPRHHYHLLHLPNVNDLPEHHKARRILKPMAFHGRLRVAYRVLDMVNHVPIFYIWELKEDYYNVDEHWSLVNRVSFTEILGTNSEWLTKLNKKRLIRVLNFQPDDGNILYLNLDGRIASYDMWNKTLTFHPCKSLLHYNKVPLQLLLPLCPTILPNQAS